MKAKHYKVLFEGKILPGNEEDSVKESLKKLFHADDTRINRLFSGKPYAIRKNVSEKDARKYEKAIMQAGGLCRIAPMEGDGELEPADWAAFEKKKSSNKISLLADINKRISTSSTEPFRLIRRIGRCQYVTFCWMVLALEIAAILLPEYLPMLIGSALTIQQTMSVTLGFHALAILVAVYAMITRLHDMNRSGSLWLFAIIPIVNLMFMLWLMFGKGSKGPNAFGKQPDTPALLFRLLGLYLPVSLVLVAAAGVWLYQDQLLAFVQELPAELSKQIPEEMEQYLPPLSS